ncbi:MAG TPA: polyprenyl synthetase family protein, partial [Gemmatimonadaceae bacterium]|nr:polyprenyl synthetase family protein [Gemmatimonadaceae bacterium]
GIGDPGSAMTAAGISPPGPDIAHEKDALRRIQSSIAASLAAVTDEMTSSVFHDAPLVAQMGHHLMGMRGKMFRPTLVLLCSNVEETPEDHAIIFAAAVELIHLATLVHDDAVDHSVLRRGMPTLNSLFSHQISVIMGDFLYSTALTKLVQLGDIDALRALTRASTEMTVGEMRQLAVTDPLAFTEEDYYALIRSKTASLMSAACEVGSLCGARAHRRSLMQYGDALGMAFQIADDLIDYTEAKETTGKPTGLDLKEHKMTLPLIAALRVMSRAERSKVESLFANDDPGEREISEVIRIVTVNGGLDYAREQGGVFADQAREALVAVPDTVARQALFESISYVMERHA